MKHKFLRILLILVSYSFFISAQNNLSTIDTAKVQANEVIDLDSLLENAQWIESSAKTNLLNGDLTKDADSI